MTQTQQIQQPTMAVAVQLKAGDILYSSWGYDQTNIDFYEVTKGAAEGKYAEIRQLKQATVETGFMCGNTTPATGEDRFAETFQYENGKPNARRVKVQRGGYPERNQGIVKVRKWGVYASPFNGREKVACSWYA